MKTALEIYKIREHMERSATDGKVDNEQIILLAMKDYAKEAIEEMAQNLDNYVLQITTDWTQIERLKNKLK